MLPDASEAVTVICVEPDAKVSPLMVQLVVPAAMPLAPLSVDQVTCVTAALSDAVPAKLIVLLDAVKLEPEVGDVMTMVGGVVSEVPENEEVTASNALDALPAASRAVTVICVGPETGTPVMVQLEVPVAVPLAPLSLAQVTCATATSSDAVPARLIVLPDAAKVPVEVGDVMAMTGGVESGVYVSASAVLDWFPVALRAVTVTRVVPLGKVSPGIVQLLDPVAKPVAPRSVSQVTWVMPALSNAVPLKLIELLVVVKLGPEVGDVMVTAGSAPASTSGGKGHSVDGVPARTAASLKQERFAPIPMPE
jgi:hypothetical protein